MDKCKFGLIIIIALAGALLAGCEVFSPRDSEEPLKPAEWNNYTLTPLKTLENLTFSYNYRENVYNYGSLFADLFVFHFDNQDVSDFHLPATWSKSSEIDMLMNTFQRINSGSSMNLILTKISEQNDNIQVNRAWLYRNYELTVYHSYTYLPQLFSGKMQLYLEKDANGFWRIKEWFDYRKLNNWSWGRMKNEFAL